MAQSSSPQQDQGYDIVIYVGLMLGVYVAIGWLYDQNRIEFNMVYMKAHYYLLWPFGLISNSNASVILQKFHWNRPGDYQFEHMVALTGHVGRYWRWPASMVLCWLTWRAWNKFGIEEIYTRIFSMKQLMQNNVANFPWMAPVAYRNIDKEPIDSGPWMVARTPLQWAAENQLVLDAENQPVDKGLLLDPKTGLGNEKSILLTKGGNRGVHIDRAKTEICFTNQLGIRFDGIERLPVHVKGLAAAFMAHTVGDKEAAQKMFNRMSLSFIEATSDSPMKIDITGADELIAKYANSEEVLYATRKHTSFVSTWMMSLLDLETKGARAKGSICCSQFIWLKPADRGLFYALNQLGGRRGWIEASGPWFHFQLEEEAGISIPLPEMASVVDDLEITLMEIGMLEEKRSKRARS